MVLYQKFKVVKKKYLPFDKNNPPLLIGKFALLSWD